MKRLCNLKVFAAVGVMALIACSFSCGGGSQKSAGTVSPPADTPTTHLANAADPLVTPTYEGSGQSVHPSIVRFSSAWHGFKYWLAMTPYPYSDKTVENPSILVSNDGRQWNLPPGLTNPIAWPTSTFLADPDIFYDAASDQLWVYYVEANIQAMTRVMRATSSDGMHWTSEEIMRLPDYSLLSPALEKIGTTYYLWSVNAGTVGGCAEAMSVELRTSTDGKTWAAPQPVKVATPGYRIWHLEVIHVSGKNELWMLATASPLDVKCMNTSMQLFARSTDGFNWEWLPKVALGPGSTWDNSHIYRSTMLYDGDGDLLQVWYSGRNSATGIWRMGYTEANYTKFLEWMK